MKTIFTFLLSSLFTFFSMARENTRLTISSIGNNKMYAEIDGRRYNLDGNTVSVRDIRAGYHNIRVFRELRKNRSIWNFGIGNRKEDNVYNSRIYLREGYHFDILINRFGKVMVDEHRIDRNDEWYNDDEDDRYDRGRDRDRESKENKDNRDPRYDNNDNVRVISDYEFNQAKESLRREWFENTRVTAAKQIMDRSYFSSQQVKEMLQLFTFENNKLDLAKYAYGRTVDKNNFYLVNDVFSFSNSKDELARYIREYR